MTVWVVGITAVAMVAFAANSLLCRLALRDGSSIGAFEFTALRLISGAIMLWLVILIRNRRRRTPSPPGSRGSWLAAFWLFLYAIAFSYAYVELSTGTGAILAFGVVQATMILAGMRRGERPGPREWLGFTLAAGGVLYLVLPGVKAPPLLPALSMATAGLAWGFYSLAARGITDPGGATAGNFLRTVPMVLVLSPFLAAGLDWNSQSEMYGAWLAITSGALASGLGYIVWYAALGYLSATRAAIVQCAAPVLAAIGGVVFLDEILAARLVFAGLAVLIGVVLATTARRRTS